MRIRFLGADGQVTGSCHVVEAGATSVMLDCGMFQERQLQERNWAPFPLDAAKLQYVVLSHAHLDHVGRLPRLVKQGFKGKVLCTPATKEIAAIVLSDSAKIQEEDALLKQKRHAQENRKGPHPIAPLYRQEDVDRTLKLFRTVNLGEITPLSDGLSLRLHEAGHILGSSIVELIRGEGAQARRLVYTGDLGLWDKPLLNDPSLVAEADWLIMESTYGGRNHRDAGQVADRLAEVVNQTVARGGSLIVPTFAVERAQEVIYHLNELLRQDKIPHLMVFLDSPMATNVTEVFKRHPEALDVQTLERLRANKSPFEFPGLVYTRSAEESKGINRLKGSCIIMAGNGMCTGGRIKHHLSRHVGRSDATLLFVGYQGAGTLGRLILDGAKQVRIFGIQHDVACHVENIPGFSAHADHTTSLRWLDGFQRFPSRVFLVHGDPEATSALSKSITQRYRTQVTVPAFGDVAELQ